MPDLQKEERQRSTVLQQRNSAYSATQFLKVTAQMDELRSQVSQERKQVGEMGIVIMMMTMMVVVVMIVIILMIVVIKSLILTRDDMSAFRYC